MNNNTKAVVAIIVIVVAAFFLYRHFSGPKTIQLDAETRTELEAQLDATAQAVRATIDSAIEKAAASGWDSTGAFWMKGRYNQSKPLLDKVFGKSFQVSDLQDMTCYRDSESGHQAVSFRYQGANYAFFLVENAPAKFLIIRFAND